jgi:hypothetical protein
MKATLSPADTLDRVLGNVNRNLASFRRHGGEAERQILVTSRNHAEVVLTRLGQATVNRAGYKWMATPAATLNEALHQHAQRWAASHPRRSRFINVPVVKGGAL